VVLPDPGDDFWQKPCYAGTIDEWNALPWWTQRNFSGPCQEPDPEPQQEITVLHMGTSRPGEVESGDQVGIWGHLSGTTQTGRINGAEIVLQAAWDAPSNWQTIDTVTTKNQSIRWMAFEPQDGIYEHVYYPRVPTGELWTVYLRAVYRGTATLAPAVSSIQSFPVQNTGRKSTNLSLMFDGAAPGGGDQVLLKGRLTSGGVGVPGRAIFIMGHKSVVEGPAVPEWLEATAYTDLDGYYSYAGNVLPTKDLLEHSTRWGWHARFGHFCVLRGEGTYECWGSEDSEYLGSHSNTITADVKVLIYPEFFDGLFGGFPDLLGFGGIGIIILLVIAFMALKD